MVTLFDEPIPGTVTHEEALRLGIQEWRLSDAAIAEIERIEQHLALSRYFAPCILFD